MAPTVRDESNWPLVMFTALSPIAVGGLAGLVAVRESPKIGLDWNAAAVLGIALLALFASLLHLGRPLRAYRAMARLSTSWLSREVVLFGIFVLLLAAYILPIHAGGWDERRSLLGILASVVGGLSLWATGEVYRLPSRPVWNHRRTVASLILGALGPGLLFGCFAGGLGRRGGGENVPVAITTLAAAALLLGVAVTCLRCRRPEPSRVEEFAAWQVAIGPGRWMLVLRIAGALCGLGILLAPGSLSSLAWVPAGIGEIADRALFFRAVVPVSVVRRAGILPVEPVKVVEAPRSRVTID